MNTLSPEYVVEKVEHHLNLIDREVTAHQGD